MRKKKNWKRILPLFLVSAIFIGGIPSLSLAAGVANGETDVSADDGSINPCMEIQDISAAEGGAEIEEDTEGIRAHEKLRDFMDKHVEPEYFLKEDNLQYRYLKARTTKKQLQILKKEAKKATADAKTQYEKIKALTFFVADRVYYDGVSSISEWYRTPYDVYKYKRAVCGGYTNLMVALCIAVDIPCMGLVGDDHAFNAVYDSDNKTWIFVDASACSNNFYGPGDKWVKRPPDLSTRFDMTPECMARWEKSYVVYSVLGVVDKKNDSAYYSLITNPYNKWKNTDSWRLILSGVKKKNIKASSEIGGFPVRGNFVWQGPKTKTVQTIDLSKTKFTSIGMSAFYDNKNLTKIIFPAGLTKIDKFAFMGCDNLETVDLSNTKLTILEDSAFADCDKLKSVDLSNTKLKKIMYFAFRNCYALRTIKLPTTLKTIANQAFCTMDRSKKYPLTVITSLPQKKLKLSNKGIWDERKVKVCGAYTIHFEGNGAEKGTMPNLLCGRDRKTALSSNKFKRSGYRFVGWSKKKNGKGKIYKNKEKVKNLAKKNKTVKLYAVWKKL